MNNNTDDKARISIIVPLYHGVKHLNKLHKMIKTAAEKVSSLAKIEWVVSNDDPYERVDDLYDDIIDVVILNTNVNNGIQGARVIGLKESSGDYIVFFDQDDVLADDYFISQLEYIGDADAVVCNGLNNGYPMYPSGKRTTLEECITREFNLAVDSGFVPGQVMIKRNSIPKNWINKWLKYNCCDDYYLWLSMYAENRVFTCNPNFLYHHIITGNNQGNDSLIWYKSTLEMLNIIHEQRLFNDYDEYKLRQTANNAVETELLNKNIIGKKCWIFIRMLSVYEKGIKFDKIFTKKGYRSIAIYGANIGTHLYEMLKREDLTITCIVDRNSEYVTCEIPVVKKESIPVTTDCIINTLIKDEREIKEYIQKHYPKIDVISVSELLNEAICFE